MVVRSGTSGASNPRSATIGSCQSARAMRPCASCTRRHPMAHGKSLPAGSAMQVTASATRGAAAGARRGHDGRRGRAAPSASCGHCAETSHVRMDARSSRGSALPAPTRAVTAAARKAQSVERFLASSIEWSLPSAALASDSRIRAVSCARRASIPICLSCAGTRSCVMPRRDRSAAACVAVPAGALAVAACAMTAPTSAVVAPVSAVAAAPRRTRPDARPIGPDAMRVGIMAIAHPASREMSALADALAIPLSPTAAATDTDAAPCTETCTDRLVNAQ